MSVTKDPNLETFSGNGVQTGFIYTVNIREAADLKVTLIDGSGNRTLQTITTHYSVSTYLGTLTMVTAPASGETLELTTGVDYDQDGGYSSNSKAEDIFDKTTFQIQQLDQITKRQPRLKESSQSPNPSLPTPSEGKALKWASDGTLENTEKAIDSYIPTSVAAIDETTGSSDKHKLIKTDPGGRLGPSFINGLRTVSVDTTLTQYDSHVRVDATSGNKTITLPTSPSREGVRIRVSKVDSSSNYVQLQRGGTSLILNTYESDTLFRLHAQWNCIEVTWISGNWVVSNYNVNDYQSNAYTQFSTVFTPVRDTWYQIGGGGGGGSLNYGVRLESYAKYNIYGCGVINCETSTTDPVEVYIGISNGNTEADIFEKRLIGKLGSDSAVTFLPFRYQLESLFETGSASFEDIHLWFYFRTVSGTPTLSNVGIRGNLNNDEGAVCVAERVY